MPRLVHIALVCLLGFVLTGLPRLVAADECARTCAEQHEQGEDGDADHSAAAPCDADCAACLCTRAACSVLPQEVAPPKVARLLLRWSTEGTGAPCIGCPREVFQPPRMA